MTAIEWTDATWNPTTGCDRVSPGCAHCYAATLAKRLKAMGSPAYQVDGGRASGPGFGLQLHPERLKIPLRWRRPRRVFVDSMSDLFHEDVPDWFIYGVWNTMAHAQQHTFQILTKRPARMKAWLDKWCDAGPANAPPVMWRPGQARMTDPHEEALATLVHTSGRSQMFHAWVDSWGEPPPGAARPLYDWMEGPRWWPNILPNVWLGVSLEYQRFARDRILWLLETPAAVRFLSCEPLLGPLDLTHVTILAQETPNDPMCELNALTGYVSGPDDVLPKIDWVIVGGESGPGHRPFDPAWAESLRDQCREAGTPLFVKQLGGARPGGKLESLPEGLQIREFPR